MLPTRFGSGLAVVTLRSRATRPVMLNVRLAWWTVASFVAHATDGVNVVTRLAATAVRVYQMCRTLVGHCQE